MSVDWGLMAHSFANERGGPFCKAVIRGSASGLRCGYAADHPIHAAAPAGGDPSLGPADSTEGEGQG